MFYRHSILMLVLVWAASCSEDFGTDDSAAPQKGRAEVVIGGLQDATRTSLGDDGRMTRWTIGDQIALWAMPEGGDSYTLDAQAFTLRTYNSLYSSADFSSMLNEPMAEGTYTYYAAYPQPASASGTTVTYELPAVQSGSYSGAHDIMAATATGGGLDSYARDELQLSFRHLLHMIRIEVPAGRNLSGGPVKRLEIEFPTEVAGSVSFDVTRPEETLTFTGSSSLLTLDFEGEGLTDTEGLYAYAFVPAGDIDGTITFRAYNSSGVMTETISTTLRRTMGPGRATPITLTIPELRPVTCLDFKVASNNLGEDLTNINISAPEEVRFIKPFSTEGSATAAVTPGEGGIFRTMVYADEYPGSVIAGKSVTVDYESESALLAGRTVMLPTAIADNTCVDVPMNVPYLFEENFDTVNTFSDNEGASGINDPAAIWIPGIPDWSAARVGGEAGRSVRIVGHREGAWGVGADYEARMDSAPISGLKEGVNVNVSISFDFSGSTNKGTPKLRYGTSTGSGSINGANANIESQAGDISVDSYGSLNGSYDNISHQITYNATCTNATRLAWVVYGSDKTSGLTTVYFYYYVYFDNIKVSIVK